MADWVEQGLWWTAHGSNQQKPLGLGAIELQTELSLHVPGAMNQASHCA
jgi:hypothetical protein